MEVEKIFLDLKLLNFTNGHICHTLRVESLTLREFHNLGRGLYQHHNHHLIFQIYMYMGEEKIVKDSNTFLLYGHISPALVPKPMTRGP